MRGATWVLQNPNSHKTHKLKAQISSKTKSELKLMISTERKPERLVDKPVATHV
ncbi:hypothetical protein HanXRQr2_Chr04g0191741 [Helianthus annuus]|uniref:Uncharacterized protein n=1 Tax=Helianthus annuus TaxID=4232 RepID=A0A9K3NUZ8_HELAN|nr:hypothetical protein HanXRQr2_Chr04g0191741 [Helianthus annuus]